METQIGGCSCSTLDTESWTCKSEGGALEPDLWQSPHPETKRSLVWLWQKHGLHLTLYWITCNATTFDKEPGYCASLMLGTWSMRSGHASRWPSRSSLEHSDALVPQQAGADGWSRLESARVRWEDEDFWWLLQDLMILYIFYIFLY